MKIDRQDYKRVKRTLRSIRWWFLLFAGLAFIAVGGAFAYFCANLLSGGTGYVIFYCVFLAVFTGIGLTGVIFALKQLLPYFFDLHALKYGETGKAVIVSSRTIIISSGRRSTSGGTYYSLTLRFDEDGEEKTYVTRYYYDEKQFEYLTRQNGVDIRYLNGRAVVVQEFPEFYTKFKDLPRKLQTLLVISLVWFFLSLVLIVCGIVFSALKMNVLVIVFVLAGVASLIGSVIMRAFLLERAEKTKKKKRKYGKK